MLSDGRINVLLGTDCTQTDIHNADRNSNKKSFCVSGETSTQLVRLPPRLINESGTGNEGNTVGFLFSPSPFNWAKPSLSRNFFHFSFLNILLLPPADAPEISLTADKAEIHEQDTVRFHCKSSAYPPPVSINWYRNDEPIKLDEGQDVLELPRVSRRANGNTISCEVRNAVGVNRSTIALNVIYKPQFKTNDKPVMAQLGE